MRALKGSVDVPTMFLLLILKLFLATYAPNLISNELHFLASLKIVLHAFLNVYILMSAVL